MFIIGYAIMAGISAGISYLAHLLLRPKRVKPPYDATPTTLAKSGTPIPQIIGRRRIGPVVAWAGKRVSYVGESGRHYFESRWDILCVGPAHALHKIWQGDKVLWEGPINRTDTPSGTTVFVVDGPEGDQPASWFTIYWGECDQGGAPPDPDLVAELGTTSIFPHHCFIVWGRKALGFSSQWPQVDYEVEVRIESDVPTLVGSSAYLAAANSSNDDGANPGHAVWMILSGSFPHGIGVPTQALSQAYFDLIGQQAQTEHLPCNMIIAGEDANDVISQFMQDVGFYMPHDGGRLRPRLIRPVDVATAPVIPLDLITHAEPEQEYIHSPLTADRVTFSFADRNFEFTTREVTWDSDGSIRNNARPQERRMDMPNITDRRTAWKVARRRTGEVLSKGQVFKFTATRGARRLVPGDSVVVEGHGQMRVQSVSLKTTSAAVDVEAVRDQYSYGVSTFFPSTIDSTELPGYPPYLAQPPAGLVLDGGDLDVES